MTEHEKLKEICDEIGYKSKYEYYEEGSEEAYYNSISGFHFYDKGTGQSYNIDVREIIFTDEFRDACIYYLVRNKKESGEVYAGMRFDIIMHNLNSLVNYLYLLIK